jgi:hypothetical protein
MTLCGVQSGRIPCISRGGIEISGGFWTRTNRGLVENPRVRRGGIEIEDSLGPANRNILLNPRAWRGWIEIHNRSEIPDAGWN